MYWYFAAKYKTKTDPNINNIYTGAIMSTAYPLQ